MDRFAKDPAFSKAVTTIITGDQKSTRSALGVAMDAARCTLAVTMASSGQAFREFEQAGWESARVVAKYHEHLSGVTTQSVEALLDAAGIRSGSRILDVATGAGYIAGAAAQRGADAIGIDFSAVQVQMACDRYPSVRFEQADAEALPFDPQSFDAVVNGFGMHHFPNPDIALREAFRVLKAGGRIAFTVWDKSAVGFGAVYAAIRAHGSLDVGLPTGPNFFFLSECVKYPTRVYRFTGRPLHVRLAAGTCPFPARNLQTLNGWPRWRKIQPKLQPHLATRSLTARIEMCPMQLPPDLTRIPIGLSLINFSLANTREIRTRAKHARRLIVFSKSAFDTSSI